MRSARHGARLAAAVAASGLTVLLATACSPTPGQAGGTAAAPAPGASAPAASAPPTIDPADVTCENMLSPETVDAFTATGWTVREDPFVILDLELPDGTACTWGDFSSPTNDDLVLFGFSTWRRTEGKAKGPPCEGCAFGPRCEGPWREYPEHQGWAAFGRR